MWWQFGDATDSALRTFQVPRCIVPVTMLCISSHRLMSTQHALPVIFLDALQAGALRYHHMILLRLPMRCWQADKV